MTQSTGHRDPLATMTPDEYRAIRAQLRTEGKWEPARRAEETESAARAVQLLSGIRN